MKILLTTREFSKNEGVAKCTVELAERFAQNNKVFLLTANYKYEMEKLKEVYEINTPQKPFFFQVLSFALAARHYIPKIKKEKNIDIVNTQKTESPLSDIVTMHSCHKAAIKKINTFEKNDLPGWKSLIHKFYRFVKPLNKLMLIVEKQVLENSKKIISVSKTVKREIIENYPIPPDKITTIPNGVDTEEFKPYPKKEFKKIRKKWNIKENDFLLFFCGHEFRRKGLKSIIQALPKLKEEVILLVGGKDSPQPYQERAEKLGVEDQVIFTGNITEDIAQYYSASDLFILPTLYEPFGLVIVEALASGVPVVSSKLAGASQLIEEKKNGMLLEDPTDSDEIASKVNRLLRQPDLLSRMKENARKTAQEHSWNKIAQKEIEIYQTLL